MILDEAQAIKNPPRQADPSGQAAQGRARIALTGTPVENRLGDLWSLFDFLYPGLLGSRQALQAIRQVAMERREGSRFAPLRNLCRPYILRRLKTRPEHHRRPARQDRDEGATAV